MKDRGYRQDKEGRSEGGDRHKERMRGSGGRDAAERGEVCPLVDGQLVVGRVKGHGDLCERLQKALSLFTLLLRETAEETTPRPANIIKGNINGERDEKFHVFKQKRETNPSTLYLVQIQLCKYCSKKNPKLLHLNSGRKIARNDLLGSILGWTGNHRFYVSKCKTSGKV